MVSIFVEQLEYKNLDTSPPPNIHSYCSFQENLSMKKPGEEYTLQLKMCGNNRKDKKCRKKIEEKS
jgi:hypothetical protein